MFAVALLAPMTSFLAPVGHMPATDALSMRRMNTNVVQAGARMAMKPLGTIGTVSESVNVVVPMDSLDQTGSFVRCTDDASCERIENLAPISADDVKACQQAWANAIQGISKTYLDGGDYVGAAGKAAGELYGYGHTNVLFKPTKAADVPFRPTGESAMSYFVGGNAVENGLEEDAGFAINGGKGWKKVVFENSQVDYSGNVAIAMGTYYFTCATTDEVTRVEYTFGYKRCDDGKPRIFLHHSSVPYSA
jgi:hypothetical protein